MPDGSRDPLQESDSIFDGGALNEEALDLIFTIPVPYRY